jgi:ribonuclease VapC
MFIDASALVAILAREQGWKELASKLTQATSVSISSLSIWEAARALYRSHEMPLEKAELIVREFVLDNDATIVAISDEIGREALRASRLFGKGRHAASLNMGDCFAYACAKVLNVPLLAMGDDFPQTDIELA